MSTHSEIVPEVYRNNDDPPETVSETQNRVEIGDQHMSLLGVRERSPRTPPERQKRSKSTPLLVRVGPTNKNPKSRFRRGGESTQSDEMSMDTTSESENPRRTHPTRRAPADQPTVTQEQRLLEAIAT